MHAQSAVEEARGTCERIRLGGVRHGVLAAGVGSVGEVRRLSFRLAAYAVCIEDGQVLLARHVSPNGESNWTLPGGRVEHGEDPFDAVIREVAEETGCNAEVERLLGVDSRLIPRPTAPGPACPTTRTSASSTESASPAANSAPNRTAKSPSRSGRRSVMWLACVGHRWSISVSIWRRGFR